MSYFSVPEGENRRLSLRFPLRLELNAYVDDDPTPGLAVDVSMAGLGVRKRADPAVCQPRMVGLEMKLPGTGETIWATAQHRFHAGAPEFELSGLLFVDMARKHRRLLHEYVAERRERWRRLFGPRFLLTSRFGCPI